MRKRPLRLGSVARPILCMGIWGFRVSGSLRGVWGFMVYKFGGIGASGFRRGSDLVTGN